MQIQRALIFHSLLLLLALAFAMPPLLFLVYMTLDSASALANLWLWLWVPSILFILALAALWHRRYIQRPLDALWHAAGALGRGEIPTHVTIRDETELAQLATQFNAMIDAREAYDKALRDTKEKYRQLAEQSPIVIYRATNELRKSALYVSPTIQDLLGYSQQEWLSNGGLWQECLHLDDRARVLDALKHLSASDGVLELEYRMYARDGRLVWVRDTVRAMSRHKGKTPLLQGALIDLTTHKLADEQMIYHARLLEQLPDAIIATDAQHKITAWNRAAAEMYGWTTHEALGEYLDALMPNSSFAAAEYIPMDLLGALPHPPLKQLRKNGEIFFAEINIIPLRDNQDRVNGYLRIHRARPNQPERASADAELGRTERRALVSVSLPSTH
ncbi:MAG: hypothetical protein B6D41_06245 [Chloroflexi bacterium UTCFX4]|jgi:PAS domain S-box-containing protein|nr:MAG: hypothetical protein B6D41_06245 [Chloroflexi bacterium UTCFX4]